MLKLRLLLLWLVACCGSAFAGGVPPTITFAPANPTTADTVTATLGMGTCGGVTTVVIAGEIIITTVQGICGVDPPFTATTLGPLVIAGTYHVRWLVAPSQTPVATATLIVAPAITFTPAHPTTADTITATLSMPTCGGATTAVVAAAQITLTTVEGGCGVPPPGTLARLGPLAAGTYQVQWLIAPSQTPVAVATLIVAGAIASAPAPALQPWVMLLLALFIAAFAAFRLRS